MTQVGVYKLKCGWCGGEVEAALYHSVNVTLDPELRGRLLKQELNIAPCRRCGRLNRYDIPLLYHDMGERLMVYYFPEEHEEVVELGREKLRERVMSMMRSLAGEGYTLEVAIGWDEFKRAVGTQRAP